MKIEKCPTGVECDEQSLKLHNFYNSPKLNVQYLVSESGLHDKDIKFKVVIVSNDKIIFGKGAEGTFYKNVFPTKVLKPVVCDNRLRKIDVSTVHCCKTFLLN